MGDNTPLNFPHNQPIEPNFDQGALPPSYEEATKGSVVNGHTQSIITENVNRDVSPGANKALKEAEDTSKAVSKAFNRVNDEQTPHRPHHASTEIHNEKIHKEAVHVKEAVRTFSSVFSSLFETANKAMDSSKNAIYKFLFGQNFTDMDIEARQAAKDKKTLKEIENRFSTSELKPEDQDALARIVNTYSSKTNDKNTTVHSYFEHLSTAARNLLLKINKDK